MSAAAWAWITTARAVAFDSSTNYTLQEYTNDIVYYIADVCNAEKVPHPTIISESGRAIVAHHSVLIVEVFGSIEKIRPGDAFKYGDSEHALVRELLDIKKNLSKANKLEAFHDAQERKEDAQQMFALGLLDLPDKARIENLYWEISQEVVASFRGQAYIPEEIRKLEDTLGRPVSLQFFRLPIAARPLGARTIVSHHAGEPLERTPHARGHAGGHHLRFRRPGQQVH